jgi:hypothetical protein
MEALEHHETIEKAGHHHSSKGIAVLIAALAALLAVCEMGGKSAQHQSLASNIEASNLWAFFQAKTVRMTTVRTAAEAYEALGGEGVPAERQPAVQKQVVKWREAQARYDDEPETNEGRKQLAARAKAAEAIRDRALAAYHNFEVGSAAFQLAIVLASASLVTGVGLLAWAAGGLGLLGAALCLLGWLAPTLIHF